VEIHKNNFQTLNTDTDVSRVKPNQMIYNENFRVLTQDNQNWILTNIKGNKLAGLLTPGFVPVCVKTRSGIAYIISAEKVNGVFTGKGEIGTYPSPDYLGTTGNLVNEYNLLRNYKGDIPNGRIGGMSSRHFNFTVEKPFSMVLQDDYDGTVNVVFTDGVNPMRIINSRFTLRDNNTYEVIDRNGLKDTNLYEAKDFETIINLISTTDKIMKVDFLGVLQGGRVKSGNYRYFFALETEDGNQTNIAGESGLVSIFHGTTPANTQGGVSLAETEKSVGFKISNLDESYPYLKVFFVYSNGEDEPVEEAFAIDARFPVQNGQVEVFHLGSEQLIRIDQSILNLDSQPIDTVGTLDTANDYILAGDITDKVIDYSQMIEFSRTITVSPTTNKIHTYGKSNNGADLSIPVDQTSLAGGTDGYNNAYINPKNIYEKLPYSSGESYPFGVRYILPGGSLTPTFPVMGMDMVNGELPYPTALNQLAQALKDQENGFRALDGMNIKGVLRFPNKTQVFDGNHLIVNGVKFKLPVIPDALKKIAIGIQFMRAETNQDRITQGVFFNTMAIPADEYRQVGRKSGDGWKFYDYKPGFTESSSKWIPTYNYRLENTALWEDYGDGSRKESIADSSNAFGIIPIRFSLVVNALNKQKKFAFLSPEIQAAASKYIGRLNNREITIKKKARIKSFLDAPAGTFNDNQTYSLIRQTGQINELKTMKAKASWVVGGDKGKNNDHFAGGCLFQGKINDKHFGEFNLNFNNYLGLTLTDSIEDIGNPSQTNRLGLVEYNKNGSTEEESVFADIYPGSGQRTTDDLKRVFGNISGLAYRPISARLYWEDTQDQADPEISLNLLLNSNREIALFGGDTFVSPVYRRMYVNGWGTFAQENYRDKEGQPNIGETMMYFAESKINSALRAEAQYDVTEPAMRSFHPFEAGKKGYVLGDKNANGNPWRAHRLLETDEYNHGFRNNEFGRFSIAFPVDSPYVASRRIARIMHSGKFTSNSFTNEWRRWEGLNYVDYDSGLGPIVRIGRLLDQVIIVQQRGISAIRLEERIAAGNTTAGPVYFESAGVLPPKAGLMSTLGSSWPESVIFTQIGAYGYDSVTGYIWKYDTKSVTPISKMVIHSYLKKHVELNNRRYSPYGPYNVVAVHDQENEEIYFSFIQTLGNSTTKSFASVYSELVQDFTRFTKKTYFKGVNILDKLHTITEQGSLYIHEQDDVPRGRIYEQQQRFKVSFVVNSKVDLEKIFALMDINSNHVFPEKITYRVPGAMTEEVIVHQGKIYDVNAKFIYNKVSVSIPKVKTVTNNDATLYRDSLLANYSSIIFENSRMRGQLMIVDLEYANTKNIAIKDVNTYFIL
jgi:hypothetical protein